MANRIERQDERSVGEYSGNPDGVNAFRLSMIFMLWPMASLLQ